MKIAVNVRDQKESEQVQKALFGIGLYWHGSWSNEFQTTPVEGYKENTCIDVSEKCLSYSSAEWFTARDYRVISAGVFFKDVLPNMEVERAAHK